MTSWSMYCSDLRVYGSLVNCALLARISRLDLTLTNENQLAEQLRAPRKLLIQLETVPTVPFTVSYKSRTIPDSIEHITKMRIYGSGCLWMHAGAFAVAPIVYRVWWWVAGSTTTYY
jgi:hypothetical protein